MKRWISLFFLLLLYHIPAMWVISPGINNGEMLYMNHVDADFCATAPDDPIYMDLVYVDAQAACDNNLNGTNFTGKAPWFVDGGSCPKVAKIKNLADAGATVVVAQPYDTWEERVDYYGAPFLATTTTPMVINVICLGISSINGDILNASLAAGYPVTVMTYQKPIQPTQKRALDRMIELIDDTTEARWQKWDDPCKTTRPEWPSRPDQLACNEDGMISMLFEIPSISILPEEFSYLTDMFMFIANFNYRLTGAMPLSYRNWTKMEYIEIEQTLLQEVDPRIPAAWPKLVRLFLPSNNLTTPLPDNLPVSVHQIIFRGNQVPGTIPESYSKLTNLYELALRDNLLTGYIPDLSNHSQLYWLTLANNQFHGFSGGLPNSLLKLDLTNNGISELPYIPASGVKQFFLGFNQLTVFPNFTGMNQLSEIILNYNKIAGDIDLTVSLPNNPQILTRLDLAGNQITSIGPWDQYVNIEQLYLSNNNLTTMPDFYSLVNLQHLDLSNNKISGNLRNDIIYNLYPGPLSYLSVRGNQIYDHPTYPRQTAIEIGQYTMLEELDLSFNKIELYMLTGEALPENIVSLFLSNNSFQGSIPEEISLKVRLKDLRLENNNLKNIGLALPTWMTYSFDRVTNFPDLGLQCPELQLKSDPLGNVALDPSYYNYLYCRCLPDFYYLPGVLSSDGAPTCQPCLQYAICPGEELPFLHGVNNTNIVARRGYYPSPNISNPITMIPCQYGVLRPTELDNPCNPDIEVTFLAGNVRDLNVSFQCKEGSSDRLCSKCLHGYYAKNGKCFLCDKQASYPTFLVILVLTLIALALYFIFPQLVERYQADSPIVYDLPALVLDFFQTTSIITSRLDNPDVTHSLQSALGVAALSTSASGLGVECAGGFPDFQTQYYWTVGAPGLWIAIMFGLFIIKILILKCFKKHVGWRKERDLFLRGCLLIGSISYFPIVTSVLTVFGCDEDPVTGERYLIDRPYLHCDDIPMRAKVAPLIIYLVGIYVLFATLSFLLGCSEKRQKDEFYETLFGFFYLPFYGARIWAGVIFMVIRLGLSIIVALVSFKEDYFALLIVWLLIMKLLFVIYQKPYRFPGLNSFDILSTVFAIFIFLNSVVFSSSSLFDKKSIIPAVTWFLLVIGLLLVGFYIILKDEPTIKLFKGVLAITGIKKYKELAPATEAVEFGVDPTSPLPTAATQEPDSENPHPTPSLPTRVLTKTNSGSALGGDHSGTHTNGQDTPLGSQTTSFKSAWGDPPDRSRSLEDMIPKTPQVVNFRTLPVGASSVLTPPPPLQSATPIKPEKRTPPHPPYQQSSFENLSLTIRTASQDRLIDEPEKTKGDGVELENLNSEQTCTIHSVKHSDVDLRMKGDEQ